MVVARLPWRFAIKIHKGFGWLLGWLLTSSRRVVMRNLKICFPDLDDKARKKLAFEYFKSMGACIAEMAFAWFGSEERLKKLFSIEGFEHVEAALAKGKGVVLCSGHFITLEICGPFLKSLLPAYAFMFHKRRNPLIDEMQTRGRKRAAHESFASNNIRAMLRSLRNNAAVWYAADQAYFGKNSRLLPFFGEPAMTSLATSKLIRVSGAQLVPFAFFRRADDSGYTLRFSAPPENFPSESVEADTLRLVSILEDDIRECPEQYLWTHRRFKGRPAPLADVYAR